LVVGVLPIYALSHKCAVAFVLAYSILFSGLAVEVSGPTIDASKISDRFLFGNFFANFNFNWLD
jgi:hypothetical protein